MRSSSLKVYSPVEYTGYKEKRSGHPSEPGSRTGNRKTTRKPKPILYRLRRFCKRLNWKGIGGLAVTTVVIVFAVRGVVGMFSEHTQTKTAPITTSSPAAEEALGRRVRSGQTGQFSGGSRKLGQKGRRRLHHV